MSQRIRQAKRLSRVTSGTVATEDGPFLASETGRRASQTDARLEAAILPSGSTRRRVTGPVRLLL